jgi:hypothetical protein
MTSFNETKPFLKDFGSPCVKSGIGLDSEDVQFVGIFNMPGSLIAFGDVNVVSEDYSLVYASDDVRLIEGDAIVVQGATYKVYEKMPIDDGVFSQVRMRRA